MDVRQVFQKLSSSSLDVPLQQITLHERLNKNHIDR